MRRGLLIDSYGRVWPVPKPDLASAGWSGARPPGVLYLGPARNGIEVALGAERVPARALSKALHILASWRPRRIVLTRCEGAGVRIKIFPGVWEFAGHAEALAPDPRLRS